MSEETGSPSTRLPPTEFTLNEVGRMVYDMTIRLANEEKKIQANRFAHESFERQQSSLNKSVEDHVTKLQIAVQDLERKPPDQQSVVTPQRGWSLPPSVTIAPQGIKPWALPRLRLEPPRFDGENAPDWIRKIQEYYNYHYTPLDDRLYLTQYLFDHPASDWREYWEVTNEGKSWDDFLLAVEQRFDPEFYQPYVATATPRLFMGMGRTGRDQPKSNRKTTCPVVNREPDHQPPQRKEEITQVSDVTHFAAQTLSADSSQNFAKESGPKTFICDVSMNKNMESTNTIVSNGSCARKIVDDQSFDPNSKGACKVEEFVTDNVFDSGSLVVKAEDIIFNAAFSSGQLEEDFAMKEINDVDAGHDGESQAAARPIHGFSGDAVGLLDPYYNGRNIPPREGLPIHAGLRIFARSPRIDDEGAAHDRFRYKANGEQVIGVLDKAIQSNEIPADSTLCSKVLERYGEGSRDTLQFGRDKGIYIFDPGAGAFDSDVIRAGATQMVHIFVQSLSIWSCLGVKCVMLGLVPSSLVLILMLNAHPKSITGSNWKFSDGWFKDYNEAAYLEYKCSFDPNTYGKDGEVGNAIVEGPMFSRQLRLIPILLRDVLIVRLYMHNQELEHRELQLENWHLISVDDHITVRLLSNALSFHYCSPKGDIKVFGNIYRQKLMITFYLRWIGFIVDTMALQGLMDPFMFTKVRAFFSPVYESPFKHFCTLRLEDKAIFMSGGIDRDLNIHSGSTNSQAAQLDELNRGPTAAPTEAQQLNTVASRLPAQSFPCSPNVE